MGHFTVEQIYQIESYRSIGISLSAFAEYVGKDKSVISREIKRNADQRGCYYKADLA